jgi:isopentenyl-diphosphate delta-isomerase
MAEVILVDAEDRAIGRMEKQEAHVKGVLHRAFSVFIFNENNELLLQQRASHKYHSGGLWTNTCCSHPAPGEDTAAAAERRLSEEMGFTTPLTPLFTFTYHAHLDHNLQEHEFDHVFIGRYNGPVQPDPEEVADYAWISRDDLIAAVEKYPSEYTVWFREIYRQIIDHPSVPERS